jgi:hypothetical protein
MSKQLGNEWPGQRGGYIGCIGAYAQILRGRHGTIGWPLPVARGARRRGPPRQVPVRDRQAAIQVLDPPSLALHLRVPFARVAQTLPATSSTRIYILVC